MRVDLARKKWLVNMWRIRRRRSMRILRTPSPFLKHSWPQVPISLSSLFEVFELGVWRTSCLSSSPISFVLFSKASHVTLSSLILANRRWNLLISQIQSSKMYFLFTRIIVCCRRNFSSPSKDLTSQKRVISNFFLVNKMEHVWVTFCYCFVLSARWKQTSSLPICPYVTY